jgi:hypothetical protein
MFHPRNQTRRTPSRNPLPKLPLASRCHSLLHRQHEEAPSIAWSHRLPGTAIRRRIARVFHLARLHSLVFSRQRSSCRQRARDLGIPARQLGENDPVADKNRRLKARDLPRLLGTEENSFRLRRMASAALPAFSSRRRESTMYHLHRRPNEGPRSTNRGDSHHRTKLHRVHNRLRQKGASAMVKQIESGISRTEVELRIGSKPAEDRRLARPPRFGCAPRDVTSCVSTMLVPSAPACVCTRRPTRSSRRCASTCRSRRRSCCWPR